MGLFSDSAVEDEADAAVLASEEIENQLQSIKKSINALDNAVQHHDQEIDKMTGILTEEFDKVSDHVEDNRKGLSKLKDLFRRFSAIQSNYIENVDVLDSELAEAKDDLSRLEARVSKMEKRQRGLSEMIDEMKSDLKSDIDQVEENSSSKIDELEEKVDELESEFILDTNRQEWDLDEKADSGELEAFKEKTEREISKLRTSINDLSDKIDPEEVEIEGES
jgi:chromosome segregation ATPase